MTVKIEILGKEEVSRLLEKTKSNVEKSTNKSLIKSAFFMQGEVKSSIAGQRAEPTSVDTGRFLNSVDINVLLNDQVLVFSDVEYSKNLEYGTSRLHARYHFRNSLNRNRQQVVQIFKEAVKSI